MNDQRKELVNEIISVANSIATMIRPFHSTEITLKNSPWTIGTAAAHLVISQRLSKKILQGDKNPYKNPKPETVAETNKQLLSEFTERRGDKLATMLIMDTENFLKVINAKEDTFKFRTHFGSMNTLTGLSYNLCHLLIHGSQIAKSLNVSLPVQEKHMPMVLPFLKQAMLATFDKDTSRNFEVVFAIHLRNQSSFAVSCKQGVVTISEQIPSKVSCHISADPVSFFLLATGIENQWSSLLKGKLFIWGQKPWLALRLTTLFKTP